MAEFPGSMFTGVTFVLDFFSLSHIKASDANVAILSNFGYFAFVT